MTNFIYKVAKEFARNANIIFIAEQHIVSKFSGKIYRRKLPFGLNISDINILMNNVAV